MLGKLLPRPSRLDRDRLLFLAGQASVCSPAPLRQPERRRWLWPAVSAVSTAAAIALAVLLALRPEPRVVREIVYLGRPEPSRAETEEPGVVAPEFARKAFGSTGRAMAESTGSGGGFTGPNYLELRRRVFEVGLAALPEPAPSSGGPNEAAATQREMLREFLGDAEPAEAPALLGWPFSMGGML